MKKIFALLILSMITFNSYAESTIVLIHGALLTSNSWSAVQSYLQNQGYNVITIDMPGRVHDDVSPRQATLMEAANKVCKVINLQSESVLLVSHSQAGAIITQAVNNCPLKIKGLLYIAAVVPLPGEKPFDLLSEKDNHNFDIVAPIDNDSGVARPDYNAPIKLLFMSDADDEDAEHAIHNMVPEPIILSDGILNYDINLFNQIPKFYIKTSMDMIISPETQDKYIARLKFDKILTINTSHSPFISQPHLLGKQIMLVNESLCNHKKIFYRNI
jgi:pimeloyl-ACP methyl ester carboxylesterase